MAAARVWAAPLDWRLFPPDSVIEALALLRRDWCDGGPAIGSEL